MLTPFFEQHFSRYQRWFSFLFTKHISTQRKPHLIWDELRCCNAYKRISVEIPDGHESMKIILPNILIFSAHLNLWLPCVYIECGKQQQYLRPLQIAHYSYLEWIGWNELQGYFCEICRSHAFRKLCLKVWRVERLAPRWDVCLVCFVPVNSMWLPKHLD